MFHAHNATNRLYWLTLFGQDQQKICCLFYCCLADASFLSQHFFYSIYPSLLIQKISQLLFYSNCNQNNNYTLIYWCKAYPWNNGNTNKSYLYMFCCLEEVFYLWNIHTQSPLGRCSTHRYSHYWGNCHILQNKITQHQFNDHVPMHTIYAHNPHVTTMNDDHTIWWNSTEICPQQMHLVDRWCHDFLRNIPQSRPSSEWSGQSKMLLHTFSGGKHM